MQYFTADLQTSKNQLRQIFGHFIIVKFEKRKTYNSWSKNENDLTLNIDIFYTTEF